MIGKVHGPATIEGGYGVVPSAKARIDTTARPAPPRPLKPAEAQALMVAELLQATRDLAASTTELTSRIGRQGAVNGVLDVALVTLDASGCYAVDYPVTVGSLVVVNHGTAQAMTVHTGPAGISAPAVGRGVQLVPPGKRHPMPVGERAFAVWGAPGDQLSLQVFTGLQALGEGSS